MKILVVEDDQKIGSFVTQSLRAEMFAVDWVTDGKEASYKARTNEYDLIVLDVMLPNRDGLEICADIRQNQDNTPILILSAQDTPSQKTKLLNIGADDYLAKPFELQELIARIRALLRRPQQIQDEVIELRDLVLDANKNLIFRDGIEIQLTRKEYMLLQYFMKHPDMVLTRGMLLEHVWDTSVDIFSNTIESHVMSLRKKINDTDKNDPVIKTVPGRGYRFVT